jgi:hypothetical protein
VLKFSVVIEGKNFPARMLSDAASPVGFFATRFIEANDAKAAELTAVQMLKDEFMPLLGEPLPQDGTPTLHLDEISEVSEFPAQPPGSGASWFIVAD